MPSASLESALTSALNLGSLVLLIDVSFNIFLVKKMEWFTDGSPYRNTGGYFCIHYFYMLASHFRIFLFMVVLSNSVFQPWLLLSCPNDGKENGINTVLLQGAISDSGNVQTNLATQKAALRTYCAPSQCPLWPVETTTVSSLRPRGSSYHFEFKEQCSFSFAGSEIEV